MFQKTPLYTWLIALFFSINACQIATLPLTKSTDFELQSLTVVPPSPILLPSGSPSCVIGPQTQQHYKGFIDGFYRIVGSRGAQEEAGTTATGKATLRLNETSEGELSVQAEFSSQQESSFLGNFHQFSGKLAVPLPRKNMDEDFSFIKSDALGSYGFLISRWDYSITYAFDVPSVKMSVNYVAATRKMTVSVEGSSNSVSQGTREAYYISSGNAHFLGTAEFTLSECSIPPAIDVQVAPGNLVGTGDGSLPGASVAVIPNKPSLPWQLKTESPGGASCQQPVQTGTNSTNLVFPFDSSRLSNGTHSLSGAYTTRPDITDQASVMVSLPVSIAPDKASFSPSDGETLNLDVKAPPCPDWDVKLQGQVVSEDGQETACLKTYQGSGDTSLVWDGKCGAGTATGEWQALLTSGSESASANIELNKPFVFDSEVKAEQAFSADDPDYSEKVNTPDFSVLAQRANKFKINGRPIKLAISSYVPGLDSASQIHSGKQTLVIRNDKSQVVYLKPISYPNGNMQALNSVLRTWIFWDTKHNVGSQIGFFVEPGKYTITAENGSLSFSKAGIQSNGRQLNAFPLTIELIKDKKCLTGSDDRFPEASLLGSKKHGIKWQEGRARAIRTNTPQGQFLSIEAVMEAVRLAKNVCPGSEDILSFFSQDATVFMPPDGHQVPATRVFIKVYPNGKVHSYPMP